MVTLNVNGKSSVLDIPDDMPLLWTLRDVLSMTGTKFGCGMGLCGACTIHIDGQPTRSCITPVSMDEAPRIDVALVKSLEAPGGIGEPGTSCVMPALTNAIFAATGKRIRKLPVANQAT